MPHRGGMWWQRQASGMDNYCGKNEADVAGATLIVRLAADGLRLAQSDGAGRIVARSWEVDPAISVLANLKAMLATVQRPPQGFARVCAVTCDHRVTIVPTALHDDRLAHDVCDACFDLEDCDALESRIVPHAGCVALFAFNRFVKRYLTAEFGRVDYFNTFALLLDEASARANGCAGRVVTAVLSGGLMAVYAHEAGKLLFSNVFECEDDNLRLFYLLHVWRALGFSQLDDRLDIVCLEGDVSGFVQLARLYVSQIVQVGRDMSGMSVPGNDRAMTEDMACLSRGANNYGDQ